MGVWQILHIWLAFTIRLRWVWVCVANNVWCLNCLIRVVVGPPTSTPESPHPDPLPRPWALGLYADEGYCYGSAGATHLQRVAFLFGEGFSYVLVEPVQPGKQFFLKRVKWRKGGFSLGQHFTIVVYTPRDHQHWWPSCWIWWAII